MMATQAPFRKGKSSNYSPLLHVSLLLNFALLAYQLFFYWYRNSSCTTQSSNVTFHGGHPASTKQGNCYCSSVDQYCMCNPSLAIDLVIFSGKDHLWLVRRKDTQQLATMGGFVDVGESVQDAVARELKEEMDLTLHEPPVLFGVYSDPRRDNRRHTASAVFAIHLDGSEQPKPADDVKAVERVALTDLEKMVANDLFADHLTIIKDYLKLLAGRRSTSDFASSPEGFARDIKRSICRPLSDQ